MTFFSFPTAETGVRPAAASLECAEREGAGAGQNQPGQESGPWSISSVRVRATVQQRVCFFSFLSSYASELSEFVRRTKLEKLQADLLDLASSLETPLGRPPTLLGS